METLTIGQLAKAAKVKITTIRFYERSGLLAPDARSSAGYRLYTENALTKLRFIKNAQHLGFTLDEIAELIALQSDESVDCNTIKQRTATKLKSVEYKIRSLQQMEKALKALHEKCRGKGPLTDCPVIEALNELPPECDEDEH